MPTTLAFVDTNVLLYAVSTNPVESDKRNAARKILSESQICFSVQVAQEFFVNAIRKLSPPMNSIEVLEFLDAINSSEIVALDYELFKSAVKIQARFQTSYWDAAIIAAAKRLDCEILYSEDLTDGQNFDGVRVVNPFRAVTKI
jgi:predicted nucleic acid-binding protein